jgi:hypothetical protein
MCYTGLSRGYIGDGDPEGIYVYLTWKNEGHSPALKAQTVLACRRTDPDSDIPTFDATPELEDSFIVGMRAPIHTPAIQLDHGIVDAIRHDQARLYIYAIVYYRDIYQGTPLRHTEVCGRLLCTGTETLRDGTIVPHFELQPVGPQNNAS